MATITLRPNSTISAGDWNVADNDIPDTLNDGSNVTVVYNTNGNQQMLLTLQSDTNSAETFVTAKITINARRGAKGTEIIQVNLETETGDVLVTGEITLSDINLAVHEIEFTTIEGINIDTANTLRFKLTGLTGKQSFITEASVTLSTDALTLTGSPIKLTSGRIQLTSGKISL